MAKKFTELVIKAPFLLTKGFVLGYRQGTKNEFPYFFHRKSGIRRETLSEMVKEVLSLECHTHLCLPDEILPSFKGALKAVEPIIDATIESEKAIKSAEFHFSFTIYNEAQARICKQLFEKIPQGVTIKGYNPTEQRNEQLVGVKEYAPLQPYIFQGSGYVKGEFDSVMDLYLRIKRSEISNSILCSQIQLNFDDKE